MYELFIELTNQIFWDGYAGQLAKKIPWYFKWNRMNLPTTINAKLMEDTIYLLVKVTIKTSCKNIHDAIEELQSKTQLQLTDTKQIRVIKTAIMPLKTRVKSVKFTRTH